MSTSSGWLNYWNGDVSLYVSRRHLEVHYRGLYEAIEPLLPASPFTVLDYGCGEALMAPALARRGGRVMLHDAATARSEALRTRFAEEPAITVVDDLSMLDGACDLTLLISVIQYVPKAQMPALLARLHRTLKPGGRLLIGDILAPDNGIVADVTALLRFARREGFLVDALFGLVRTLGSDYSRQRGRLGLATHTIEDLSAMLVEARFSVGRLERNIGHADHRSSIMATRLI